MSSVGVFLLSLGLIAASCFAEPTTRPAATVARDVVYGRAEGVKLTLDVSVPPGDGPHPAVILVHGGAWQAGDKTHFHSLFDPLTRAGYAWFSVNYRLAPKYRYPACLDDVETAVRWVKEHAAEYHVDPDRVALLGESAGGHLVELVAGRATDQSGTRTAAVVAMYAPSDLLSLADTAAARGLPIETILKAVFGQTQMTDAVRTMLRDASPLAHVHAGLPPFLLLHGTADRLVPYQQSASFADALKAAGVDYELVPVRNGPHGMMLWNFIDPTYKDKILAFLARTLK